MVMKKVLAGFMAIALVGGIATPSFVSKAEGLTQASSPDQVSYGTVTAEEAAILKTVFDPEYYLLMNPDLKEVVGTDFDKLFEHFCTLGIFERRACNANFDVSAYASAYPDLKDSFGLDIVKYYEHYATVGKAENRTLTTIEACANAGITVTVISETPYEITPNTYKIAKLLGTSDLKTVSTAIASAAAGKDVVVSSGSGKVVMAWSDAAEKLEGLTLVGTYTPADAHRSVGHYVSDHIYIFVDNNSVYAALAGYNNKNDGVEYNLVEQDFTTVKTAENNYTGYLIYTTADESSSFNKDNAKFLTEISYSAGDPSTPKSIITGSMPSGGIDVSAYTHNREDDDVSVEENIESTGNYYSAYYNDGWGWSYNDVNGDVDDVYDISINITPTEEGANVTFAVSNEDNQYANIVEAEITDVTPPASEETTSEATPAQQTTTEPAQQD